MESSQGHHLIPALDGMRLGLIVIDPQGAVRYVNTQAALWDQVPPRELVGRALPEGCPGWLSPVSADGLRQAVESRADAHYTELSPDLGIILETRVAASAAGVVVWVGETRESEAAQDGAELRMEALISGDQRSIHELMQPLGAISNYAELIRQQSIGPAQRYAIEITRIVRALAARIRRPGEPTAGSGATELSGPPPVRDDQ